MVKADAASSSIPVHGYLKSRYLARWTDGAQDQDLYETLSLDVGDPSRHRVTAHFLGDFSVDLDKHTDNQGYYAYDSARDAKGSWLIPRVYSAYLDFHRVDSLGIARVGRQTINETPVVSFFDGVRAESTELGSLRLKLGAYGGIPVYLYQNHQAGDLMGGAYAEGRLWQGFRARVDWQHIDGHNGGEEFKNTLVAFGGWQTVGRYLDVHANFTRMDNENRDVLARATFHQPEWDFRLQASYYELLQIQQNAVIGADSLYPVLKDYQPYREYRWMASKGVGDHVNLDAGMDLRRLSHEENASAFNHQYDRYFATLDLIDLGVKGSSLSVTGDKWVSSDRQTDSLQLDLTLPIGKKSKVSGGTAHYLYKYDYYSDQERTDVQAYYVKFEHAFSRSLRTSVDYSFEHDSSSTNYNELRFEVICSF